MAQHPLKSIAIFGNGLTGLLCASKLIKVLPSHIELRYIEAAPSANTDIFFGTTTTPSIYNFFLGLGVTEPELLQKTNTSFSLGTEYRNWGAASRSWTQAFYRPLPLFNGVGFHHYLTRLDESAPEKTDISPYIMSVQAALRGVFAHPPEGKNIPLADVEYGYHFDPAVWADFLKSHLRKTSIHWSHADIESFESQANTLKRVKLDNGKTVDCDFFIDALGQSSKLRSIGTPFLENGRRLGLVTTFADNEKPEGVCRTVESADFGWRSKTPLQNGMLAMSVFDPDSQREALNNFNDIYDVLNTMELGQQEAPWSGNCLTLGHGAAVLEPLTPAPLLLLQRDIERLAELIPVNQNMKIESREYNRRFQSDYEHAALFSRAFFAEKTETPSPYWNAATDQILPPKLRRKIHQFEGRGVAVQYDYEPFSAEDWTLQHFGMGRFPKRYDPLADHMPKAQLEKQLEQMRIAIETMASKMPPQAIYMASLQKYLRDKHG